MIDAHHVRALAEQLEHGGPLLWVRTVDAEAERKACDILARNGGNGARTAVRVTRIDRRLWVEMRLSSRLRGMHSPARFVNTAQPQAGPVTQEQLGLVSAVMPRRFPSSMATRRCFAKEDSEGR